MKKAFLLLIFVFTAFLLSAANFPEVKSYVNDYAGIMNESSRNEASALLEALEKQTGDQVCVVTVKSLSGYSIEEYAFYTAEQNKIGQQGKDNGALLLVSLDDRALRIETGYGLEGQLTDTKCGLIIRNTIIPYFQSRNYSQGILGGVKKIASVLCPDGIEGQNLEVSEKSAGGTTGPLFGFLFVFGWFILFSCLASGRKNHFLPWILWASSASGRHSGYYNHTGNSGFHSNHGGGFGGFSGGGGHFGGGGSSGHW